MKNLWDCERQLHQGAMVALYLSPADAERLVVDHPQATPADEMHLTLLYLGRVDEMEVDRDALTAVLRDFAATNSPLSIKLTGVGRFFGVGDGDEDAYYAIVESVGLQELRGELVTAVSALDIEPDNPRDFTPHITLAYLQREEVAPAVNLPETEINLGTLTLKWGDERVDYPLGENKRESRMSGLTFMRAVPDIGSRKRRAELLRNKSLPVPVIASTSGMKRDGKDLKPDQWSFERYDKYPIVLYGHDYAGRMGLPIGLGQNYRVEGDALKMDVMYDEDDDFAQKCRNKTIKGMLAFSVSWDEQGKKNELIELSNVNVGLDPDALPDIERAALRDFLGGEAAYRSLIDQIRQDVLAEMEADEPDTAEEEDMEDTQGYYVQTLGEDGKPVRYDLSNCTITVAGSSSGTYQHVSDPWVYTPTTTDGTSSDGWRWMRLGEQDEVEVEVEIEVEEPEITLESVLSRALSVWEITDKVWAKLFKEAGDFDGFRVEDLQIENGRLWFIVQRDGQYYRLAVNIDENESVTFGEPVPVRKKWEVVATDGRESDDVNSRSGDTPEDVLETPESEEADAKILEQLFTALKER